VFAPTPNTKSFAEFTRSAPPEGLRMTPWTVFRQTVNLEISIFCTTNFQPEFLTTEGKGVPHGSLPHAREEILALHLLEASTACCWGANGRA
jgi:hypothetical protein